MTAFHRRGSLWRKTTVPEKMQPVMRVEEARVRVEVATMDLRDRLRFGVKAFVVGEDRL